MSATELELLEKLNADHRNHKIVEVVITFILMAGVSTLIPIFDLRWWITLGLHTAFGISNFSDGVDRGFVTTIVRVRRMLAEDMKEKKEGR